MNCEEFEEQIYTYRELSPQEQTDLKKHIQSCDSCQSLFDEVNKMTALAQSIKKVEGPDRVNEILVKVFPVTNEKRFFWSYSIIARWSMAAASAGIIILFFVEALKPMNDEKKINGPLVGLQNVLVNSASLRESFMKSKERPSLFSQCANLISGTVDKDCIKEKKSKM